MTIFGHFEIGGDESHLDIFLRRQFLQILEPDIDIFQITVSERGLRWQPTTTELNDEELAELPALFELILTKLKEFQINAKNDLNKMYSDVFWHSVQDIVGTLTQNFDIRTDFAPVEPVVTINGIQERSTLSNAILSAGLNENFKEVHVSAETYSLRLKSPGKNRTNRKSTLEEVD